MADRSAGFDLSGVRNLLGLTSDATGERVADSIGVGFNLGNIEAWLSPTIGPRAVYKTFSGSSGANRVTFALRSAARGGTRVDCYYSLKTGIATYRAKVYQGPTSTLLPLCTSTVQSFDIGIGSTANTAGWTLTTTLLENPYVFLEAITDRVSLGWYIPPGGHLIVQGHVAGAMALTIETTEFQGVPTT